MASKRFRFLIAITIICFGIVSFRLFYWQILSGKALQALGLLQYESEQRIEPIRGSILSSDNFPLVFSQKRHTLFAYKPSLNLDFETLSRQLAPLLEDPVTVATLSASLKQQSLYDLQQTLIQSLSNSANWVPLKRHLDDDVKSRIEARQFDGLGFNTTYARAYPEASLSAHLLGFVGSDDLGFPKGYFGLEGFYDRELTGKSGFTKGETDVFGRPILYGNYAEVKKTDGRQLKTHLDRGLQLLVENHLKNGLERYQAISGEVVIMEPQTGAILALASFPSYDPANFNSYPGSLYRIPSIAETYEPGSTFKVIVISGAIDKQLITPDTVCDSTCAGPVPIGQYRIRTWNDQYYEGQTIREVLERSDNTGMVFVAQKMAKVDFIKNLEAFGIGSPTNIDLEAESVAPLRKHWGDIDIATAAFGQGIAVNSIQMLMAVGAIANQGKRMEPHLVSEIIDPAGNIIPINPKVVRQAISPQSALVVSKLMEAAAKHGEAQWAIPNGYRIAGKTGTAQIPLAGHYDAQKTIASFVGFAPADNPKFVMIVKLREPQSSPWASETAAPLWVKIAKDIFVYYNIPPS